MGTVLDPSKLHLKFYIINVIANQVPGFRLASQSSSFIQYQITPGLGIEPYIQGAGLFDFFSEIIDPQSE